METWYRVDSWGIDIKPVKVIKRMKKFVEIEMQGYLTTFTGRARIQDNYFPTFQEARDYLINRERAARIRAVQEADYHSENIAFILDYKEPENK